MRARKETVIEWSWVTLPVIKLVAYKGVPVQMNTVEQENMTADICFLLCVCVETHIGRQTLRS